MKRYWVYILPLVLLGFFSFVLWDSLSLQPFYSDDRFPPTDKLHAGCVHTADIMLSTDLDIKDIHVVLEYDPDKIDILRVIPDSKNREEVIEYDIANGMVEYHHTNMVYVPWYDMKVFNVMFDSANDVTTLDFSFASGSYAITRNDWVVYLEWTGFVDFVSVPECNPDIVPPSVKLVKPQLWEGDVALDSTFVFEMTDKGKGVDPNTIYVTIDKDVYTASSPWVMYSGDFIVIQPKNWLPVGQDVQVTARVSDLQAYGWANTMEKSFIINTAKGVQLDSWISPLDVQRKSRDILANRGALQECILLDWMLEFMRDENKSMIENMFEKLDCDIVLAQVEAGEHSSADVSYFNKRWLSIFAITWWVLFFLTLILKIHYFVAYKKHMYTMNK